MLEKRKMSEVSQDQFKKSIAFFKATKTVNFGEMSSSQSQTAQGQGLYVPLARFPLPPVKLEAAVENTKLVAKLGYRDGGKLIHQGYSHRLDHVVEFRNDLVTGTSFFPIWPTSLSPFFERNVFHPTQPYVYTVVEAVTHYQDVPYCTLVNGAWVEGKALIPLAQHICVCLDDGVKRYEEVIR